MLRTRFAGAEDGSRVSQVHLNIRSERMCATQTAPRGRCRVLEHRDGLTEIGNFARGAIFAEGPRVIPSHPERVFITLSQNALRRGYIFAQQRLGFSEFS